MEANELREQYANGKRDFSGANLYDVDLSGANLSGANFTGANLSEANLTDANLTDVDLHDTDLSGANLHGANLHGANLTRTNLRVADLSGTTGLLDPAQWLRDNFEFTDKGVIVYKAFNAVHSSPAHWVIKAGSVITETVNPDRCTSCGSGINFAHREWRGFHRGVVWKCLIEWVDLAGVIVPYNTDGKARCSRMTLLEIEVVD